MPEREQPKSEQAEAKGEVTEAKLTDVGAPRIDRRYSDEVSRYFKAARELAFIGAEPSEEEEEFEAFLAEQQRTLEKLADPRWAKRVTPKEASLALSELAGSMATDNPETYRTGDSELDAQNERKYLEAKRLFMESAAKIFPDAKPEFSQLVTLMGQLSESVNLGRETGISDFEVEHLMLENPKKLAEILDHQALDLGHVMMDQARLAYASKDRATQETKLATAAEALYKLQLMRDKLQEHIYGRADVTPSEARKIDTIREEFKSKSAEAEKAKVPETKEQLLKSSKEKFGFNKSQLERGLGKSLSALGLRELGDDPEVWRKAADGLETIRRAWTKDNDPAFKKASKYEKQIRELFESLR